MSNGGNEYDQHSLHSYMEIHNETSYFVQLYANKIHNLYSQCLWP